MNDLISHIKAVLFRNIIWAMRSPFRLADVLIWPVLTLFTLSFFLSVFGSDVAGFIGLIVLAVIGWRAVFFLTFETTAMFIEENWDKSLPNLLVSPISTLEIALGGSISGMYKTIAVVFLCLAIGFFIYGYVPSDIGTFLFALIVMMLAGLSIGFTLFGLACYFDKRNVFTLSFLLPEVICVFSGPYYNVGDVFPPVLAAFMNLFPTTHGFNLIKSIFGMAQVDYVMLGVTTVLWLTGAILINRIFYNLGRKKGTLTKVG
jgi:ABC-type multidrug transport system permease subunit